MTFVPITKIVKPSRTKAGCRVRLLKHKSHHPAVCIINVNCDLLAQVGASPADRFGIQVGEDADRGKLRLFAAKGGIAKARHEKRCYHVTISLGHIGQFPDRYEASRPCKFEVVGDNIIEISLPPWSMEATVVDKSAKAVAQVLRPNSSWEQNHPHEKAQARKIADVVGKTKERPSRPSPEQPKPKPIPALKTETPAPVRRPVPQRPVAAKASSPPETYNDVTVTFARGHETVTHQGKSLDIGTHQAGMLAILARAMPGVVGRNFVVGKLWPQSRSLGESVLTSMAADLARDLPQIGLELYVAKFDLALRKINE